MLNIYLVIINAMALVLMLADKLNARKKRWRVPESVLLGMVLLGGSVGALAGMYLCRHKTRKKKFSVGIPVILALQVLLYILLK